MTSSFHSGALRTGRGPLGESIRVDALRLGGVLDPQVVVGLQQRPVIKHMCRRNPALGQPPVSK